MASNNIENSVQQLEMRVAALEKEVAIVKLRSSELPKKPSWHAIVGTFENDPTFDEAVRLGEEWRKSALVSGYPCHTSYNFLKPFNSFLQA